MQVTLNIDERVAIMVALKSKQSSDIDVLLDFYSKAMLFDLTPEEKKRIGWKLNNEIASYKNQEDDPKYLIEAGYDLSDQLVADILDMFKELAGKGLLTARSGAILTTYQKLKQAPQ